MLAFSVPCLIWHHDDAFCLFDSPSVLAKHHPFVVVEQYQTVGERLTLKLRQISFRAFLRQNMGWYDEELNQPRLLAAKLATEASAVKGVATENVGMMTQIFIMMTAGIVLAFYYGWQLALVTIGMGPVIGYSTKLQMDFLKNTSSDSKLALEKSSQVASESLAGIRTISAFANETQVHHRYASLCAHVFGSMHATHLF